MSTKHAKICIHTEKCNRCGKCCFYFLDGKLKKCRYLLFINYYLKKDISFCRIYPHGFGREIDKNIFCNKDPIFNYPGCPYNSDEKPEFSISEFPAA